MSNLDVIKNAVNTLICGKPSDPKVRYAVVEAGSIAQSAFMPGILQTTNSGKFYSCFISHQNDRLF